MRRRFALAALAAAIPVAALAGAPTITALLSRVPPVPHDAAAAYAQWTDANGTLSKGRAFTDLENEITNAAKSLMMAAQSGGGSMMPGAVSPHDQAAMKLIQPNPQSAQLRTKIAQAAASLATVRNAYEQDVQKLDAAENAEIAKLPVCPGEAGEPSDRASLAVKLKYADQRIGLANSALGKDATIVGDVHHAVASETTYTDNAFTAWASMSDGMMKTVGRMTVAGMQVAAIGDVGVVLGYVEDSSKSAAEAVANKNKLARDAAQAKGC